MLHLFICLIFVPHVHCIVYMMVHNNDGNIIVVSEYNIKLIRKTWFPFTGSQHHIITVV